MTKQDPAPDALFEQAERFRARLADAPRNVALRRRVAHWRAQDPAHDRAFSEAESLWALVRLPATEARQEDRHRRWRISAMAIAASIGGLLLIPDAQRMYQDLRSDVVAGAGERRDVTLADGSRVAINSDTALDFEISGDKRSVRMFRGEAYFAVAHDAARPFTVRSGDAAVTVLGTRFNVHVNDTGTRVTVEEGRVRLETKGSARVLTSERQGTASKGRMHVRAAYSADATAWRRGRAVYYNAPLSDVVGDLRRYGGSPIYIFDGNLRRRRVTGAFRTDTPEETLAALRSSLRIKSVSLPGGSVILY